MPATGSGIANLNYDIRISANPMVNVGVQLDELTGDVIKGRGTGNLRITSGTTEPLTLQGRYNIESGSYEFTFQALLKKPFLLKRGGNNFIECPSEGRSAGRSEQKNRIHRPCQKIAGCRCNWCSAAPSFSIPFARSGHTAYR